MEAEPQWLLDVLEDLLEEELRRFQWHLTTKDGVAGFQHIKKSQLDNVARHDTVSKMVENYGCNEAVEITLIILKKMNHNRLAEELKKRKDAKASSGLTENTAEGSANAPAPNTDEQHDAIRRSLKNSFISKFAKLYQGTSEEGDHVFLNDIFTELYIIEGYTGGVYNTHEVRQVEALYTITDETPIQFSDIFKVCSGELLTGTKVLTVGIAGVGKTVSVHKFILDWAEGESNQDIDFLLFFPFRELNIVKDELYTLWELILYFHDKLHGVEEKMFSNNCTIAFIFDGLDESRIPLNFNEKKVSSIKEKTTVGKLITNLIKGDLLKSALIWITSRPAAASKIPRRYFDHITEIRGFTDDQKEKYFKKRVQDEETANKLYTHIKSSRSLHILCHIPVFCWIAASVLLQMLRDGKELGKAPTTLTEMYIRFLLFQTRQMKEKYKIHHEETLQMQQGNKEVPLDILKLAKLAFHQLEKGQLIFYESDLKDCDIDADEALVYSGVCTQIFKKDEKVYSFVHLSFQEFLAALYVFLKFSAEWNPFLQSLWGKMKWRFRHRLCDLQKTAVNKALQSESGHLDLLLRFLLGLSLESNQRLLKSLQPQMQIQEESVKEITDFIKSIIKDSKHTDRCINLFHCLSELKDNSLPATIQNYLKSGDLTSQNLSMAQWSALVFELLMSEETQETFELKKYRGSHEGLRMLVAVVKHTRRALLDHCSLSTESCKVLASVLSSKYLPLREMDLSNNNLQDSGVELLSDGLNNPFCKLEVLWLRCCNLTESSCEMLALVLKSENSVLKELDLSHNELKDSGVKLLCTGLEKPHCKLEKLKLSLCLITKEGCSALASALSLNPSHLRELDLSFNHPGESGVKLLITKKEDPHCRLDTLRMDHGEKLWIKSGPRKYACELTLDPNTAHTYISLSEDNQKLESARKQQPYPELPERFKGPHAQVLCRESLTGRCYWEVEWKEWAEIAVAYKGILREGDSSGFGANNMSWSLNCSKYGYCVSHNHVAKEIRISTSNRVGVYLDWPVGTLTFYDVSKERKLNHIRTFEAKFTEPVYAGFGVFYNDNQSYSYSSISLLRLSAIHPC